MKIDVLGTEYELELKSESEDIALRDCDGYCDESTKRLVVETYATVKDSPNAQKDLSVQQKKVIRHELTHAFLSESGLAECSWANNEEIVDWIARMGPRLVKAWESAGAMPENKVDTYQLLQSIQGMEPGTATRNFSNVAAQARDSIITAVNEVTTV